MADEDLLVNEIYNLIMDRDEEPSSRGKWYLPVHSAVVISTLYLPDGFYH